MMMPKLMQNKMKWKAELLDIEQALDLNDRPVTFYKYKRVLFYEDIGVTAQEKYLSQQAKTDVVRRIKCRWDDTISEKTNGLKIDGIEYNITRIYTDPNAREMELSLAYVD